LREWYYTTLFLCFKAKLISLVKSSNETYCFLCYVTCLVNFDVCVGLKKHGVG
jgi:hypothetical protein